MRIKNSLGQLLLREARLAVALITTTLLITVGWWTVLAQSDEIAPNANLELSGIPKVPATLPSRVNQYTKQYGLPLAGWDPMKHELWVKGMSSAAWISKIEAPGAAPKTWVYIPMGNVYDLYFSPQAKQLVYNRDANGNETFQMYLYNLESRASTPLSDGRSRNTEPVWSNAGDRIVYCSAPQGSKGVSLHVLNPNDPQSDRLLVQSTGNYLKAFDWSPDDRRIIFHDSSSVDASTLWIVDVKTGEKNQLSPVGEGEKELYESPQFSKDGKGVYVITDHDSDIRRLAYLDLATKRFKYLSDSLKWDVDEFQLTRDGKRLAFVANEDGVSRLYLLDVESDRLQAVPDVPIGIISDLKWHNNSTDLAFNFKSPRTPNDVYSLNTATGKIERWAKSNTGGVDLEKLSIPEVIRWKSFDGRTISGFLYRPPTTFTGKRPVIIDIHGGPAEQYRPGFGYDSNFFLNELGVVKIYPNVRGSSGYGKTFLNLDNGVRREDAVKDIGALLDWIKSQPDLDVDRVLVQGASYGGYMALSVAVKYSDRIRGVMSDFAPSNLATFLERTADWRRDVQRAEFGDERDPKAKAFMERTAPLNNVQKIKKPLLIVQGKNDPRVPVEESEALVSAVKKQGTPVWYLLGKDEGHGFVKRSNWDFRLYTTILFVQEYLLK